MIAKRESTGGWLYWTPRLLCLAFAGLVSIFAFDVFEESRGFWQTTGALLLHLVPTFVILAGLAAAWRWEWTGAILFTGLGVLYVAWFAGRFPWFVYVLIAGPLILIGVLFLLGWRRRLALRAAA